MNDLAATVWVNFQWVRLPWWRRAWLILTGQHAVTRTRFRRTYWDFPSVAR